MTTTTPGLHEGRLRAMLDPASLADWGLNDEDRAAIRWALDALVRLKTERDGVRQELNHEQGRIVDLFRAIDRVRHCADQVLLESRRASL